MAEPLVREKTRFPIDLAWLAKGQEEILDPDLPIIDTHHHLWDRAYRYLLDELLEDTGSGHNIRGTVFLETRFAYRASGPEPMKALGEVEFANGVAAMGAARIYGPTAVCAGIVGRAELLLGDKVEDVLEAQMRAAGSRFKGIRYGMQFGADPALRSSPRSLADLLGDRQFLAGFGRLAHLGLSADCWVFDTQILDLARLARRFPQITIVANHLGGVIGVGSYAGRRRERFPTWKADMAELAECGNVMLKVGGLGMVNCGFGFETRALPPTSTELATAWKPYVTTGIELFGSERCMFESNFPVDKTSCSYAALWNAFKRITSGASPSEKHALYFETARRVYRLDIAPTA